MIPITNDLLSLFSWKVLRTFCTNVKAFSVLQKKNLLYYGTKTDSVKKENPKCQETEVHINPSPAEPGYVLPLQTV